MLIHFRIKFKKTGNTEEVVIEQGKFVVTTLFKPRPSIWVGGLVSQIWFLNPLRLRLDSESREDTAQQAWLSLNSESRSWVGGSQVNST